MFFSDEFYFQQIDKALENSNIISTKDYPRIVIFSDCHRGAGTWNDSFLNNKTIYEAAMSYYYDGGFCYIELGDGDELWENRRFSDIQEIHKDIFNILKRFEKEKRLFMLWGNHDRIKEKTNPLSPMLPVCSESLIIQNPENGCRFNLIHGHQVDPLNNQFWKLARWLVRYFWKPLELSGIKDPTSSARNYGKRKAVETRMSNWAKYHNTNLISGHTHRPTIPPPGSTSGYYNSGSCVHPDTITCIEIVNGQITLIKWAACADDNLYIKVCRYVLGGPTNLP